MYGRNKSKRTTHNSKRHDITQDSIYCIINERNYIIYRVLEISKYVARNHIKLYSVYKENY